MTLAYEYPLLSVFVSMLWFFLFVIWIMILFRVFADIFRTHDMGGFAKTLWIIFVIIAPFLGVLVYVLARGDDMAQRDLEDAKAQDAAFQSYVKQTAGAGGTADELSKLAALRDAGQITEAEFAAGKAKILG
jgi:hypothetical protein